MKEVCKNCKKFIEKEDKVIYVYRYCCDPEEGRQEITNCVTDFDKPEWCPGFVEPPEELPDDMEGIFKSRAVPASYSNTKATTATKSFLEEENMEKFIVYLVGERVCVVEGEEVMFDDTANSYKIGNNEFPRENVIAIVEV